MFDALHREYHHEKCLRCGEHFRVYSTGMQLHYQPGKNSKLCLDQTDKEIEVA